MPQASGELRRLFADDGAAFLAIRGTVSLSRGGVLSCPWSTNLHWEQLAAIQYLCDEWDYAFQRTGDKPIYLTKEEARALQPVLRDLLDRCGNWGQSGATFSHALYTSLLLKVDKVANYD